MSQHTGGPAFPIPGEVWHAEGDRFNDEAYAGMTLRDYFAAKAMQGMMTGLSEFNQEKLAAQSYIMADAMLNAREA
jgi:hypothetical protein